METGGVQPGNDEYLRSGAQRMAGHGYGDGGADGGGWGRVAGAGSMRGLKR